MGLIVQLLSLLFGDGKNVLAETAEVFTANAEADSQRDLKRAEAALDQFAKEFQSPAQGRFDRVMDGINRIPRPAMALGTLALFAAAMADPVWFAARMQGLTVVPEPLWWLLGAVVSFYFGARHQTKGQEFHRSMAATMARAQALRDIPAEPAPDDNAALAEMRR